MPLYQRGRMINEDVLVYDKALWIIGHFETEGGKPQQFVMATHQECAKLSNQLEFDAGLRRN
jgi:hypothetical protein